MKYFFIILVITIIVVIAYFITKSKNDTVNPTTEDTSLPYSLNKFFFTKHENSFYKELLPLSIEYNLAIFPKVRIIDFIKVDSNNERQKWFNKISSKHVDFLLCSNDYYNPKIIIELDDYTHDKPNRIERDKFIDNVAKSAGIPILHIRSFNKETIENEIKKIAPVTISNTTTN